MNISWKWNMSLNNSSLKCIALLSSNALQRRTKQRQKPRAWSRIQERLIKISISKNLTKLQHIKNKTWKVASAQLYWPVSDLAWSHIILQWWNVVGHSSVVATGRICRNQPASLQGLHTKHQDITLIYAHNVFSYIEAPRTQPKDWKEICMQLILARVQSGRMLLEWGVLDWC